MPLTAEQEKLVTDNIALTHYFAKRYFYYGMDQEDIASVGTIGLVEASQRFDESKGVKFATFASRCINNRIIKNIVRPKTIRAVSLNNEISEDGSEMLEITPSDVDVEQEVSFNSDLTKALSVLSDRERFVITRRFGLDGLESLRQIQVGELLNISQMQVSRIEKKALARLREFLKVR